MSKFQYVYTTVKDDCKSDGFEYVGYGICVTDLLSHTCFTIHDISVRGEEIERLAKKCNELQLDPIHIEDVIEDFLFAI